mgnify:FL=1
MTHEINKLEKLNKQIKHFFEGLTNLIHSFYFLISHLNNIHEKKTPDKHILISEKRWDIQGPDNGSFKEITEMKWCRCFSLPNLIPGSFIYTIRTR